jgi:hypothetical protein
LTRLEKTCTFLGFFHKRKMLQTSLVYDSTALSRRAVYEIYGFFYRYKGSDPFASIRAPRYSFEPLAGQRRHAELVLNHRKLTSCVYQVQGLNIKPSDMITGDYIQLSLF